MYWTLLGVPTLFDFTELPGYLELENDRSGVRVRYVKLKQWSDDKSPTQHKASRSGIACPKCGSELLVRNDIVLTTYPPQRQYFCRECGFIGTK